MLTICIFSFCAFVKDKFQEATELYAISNQIKLNISFFMRAVDIGLRYLKNEHRTPDIVLKFSGGAVCEKTNI